MNIAITGSTGFVGKYAVEYFKSKGHNIIALGRDIKKLNSLFDNYIIKKETDLSYESLLDALSKADVIVHLAAKRLQRELDPLSITPYIDSNIIFTQNLLKAAQVLNISRFCQASSISVYSALNSLPYIESEAPFAISIYGVSKLTCEHLGDLFSARSKTKVTNLRFASLFGIGEKAGVVTTDYVNLAKEKKTLEIWGKGKTKMDLIYIKDAVCAIEQAILPNSPFGTYNIGSGMGYSVKEIAENINEAFKNTGNVSFLTDKKEGGYQVYMDATKAEKDLGWKPKWSLRAAFDDIRKISE